MPSFDIVCEINTHELQNAVDQAQREISTRYDFKGSNASILLNDGNIDLLAEDINRLHAVTEILRAKMVRRGLESKSLDYGEPERAAGDQQKQHIQVKQGVEQALAKSIVKQIKQEKLKVQAAIQGEQVRITGKKRDDLQSVIALVKKMDADRPLQCINFRD
ncbi:MAG: YajQ family cyclic di-GMP-binding protein [Mariprofundaceae bacterium]|nr:YajQ family cyclic di-GMP-binding protein [Mariprofundaceae bacterium]